MEFFSIEKCPAPSETKKKDLRALSSTPTGPRSLQGAASPRGVCQTEEDGNDDDDETEIEDEVDEDETELEDESDDENQSPEDGKDEDEETTSGYDDDTDHDDAIDEDICADFYSMLEHGKGRERET